MTRKGIAAAGLALALAVSAGACTGRNAAPAAPPPAAPASAPSAAPPVEAPPVAAPAPVGTDIRGGGTPGLRTVVESVTVEPAGGGAEIRITFRDGVPVWSAHTGAHGQQLFLELGAPLAAGLTKSGKGADVPVSLSGGPFGALVTVATMRNRVRYTAEEAGRILTVTVSRGEPALEGGAPPEFPGMERANRFVAAFLQARIGSSLWPDQSLSDLARLQYRHLYGATPPVVRGYRDWRQSGQWPGDAAIHLVRVEGDGWFADEMLYVTAKDGEPRIAMVLGHPPVAVPAGADGQAALRAAETFLHAEARRDRTGMWGALSPSAQQQLGSADAVGVGVSNPHPFRFEIQGVQQAGPDCWRFDVLRSQEYTGEGELGWGVGPLFVAKEEGRFGVLWDKACGQ